MSEIDNLIDGLSEEEIAAYSTIPSTGDLATVEEDRTINVPESIKELGVQRDHYAETRWFIVPRHWNDVDLAGEGMQIFINYLLPDGTPGSCTPSSIDTSSGVIGLEWKISNQVTAIKGNLTVLICVKKMGMIQVSDDPEDLEEGEVFHWNTKPNRDFFISEGLDCDSHFVDIAYNTYPDIITSILSRLDASELEEVEARLQVVNDLKTAMESALAEFTASKNQIDDALMVGRVDTENGGEIFNTYEGDNKNQAVTGSVAYGEGTAAMSSGQYVAGVHNIPDSEGKYAYIVGNGTADAKSNAITVNKDGVTWYKGGMVIGGTDDTDLSAPFYVIGGRVYFYGKEVTFGGTH